jgi:hypothetical protein
MSGKMFKTCAVVASVTYSTIAITVEAGPLVTATRASSVLSTETGVGGLSNSAKISFVPTDSYEHVFGDVRNREPLQNRVAWQFNSQTESLAQWQLEADAYSTFIPESSGIDRFGNPFTTPAFYSDSIIKGETTFSLSQQSYVTVMLEGEGIRGLESFTLDYFGRSVNYTTDPQSGTLLPETTLPLDLSTPDPLDLLDYSDGFWLPAGEGYLLDFEMLSAHVDDGTFLDGHVRIIVNFATVIPEPASLSLFAVGAALVLRSRSRCNRCSDTSIAAI